MPQAGFVERRVENGKGEKRDLNGKIKGNGGEGKCGRKRRRMDLSTASHVLLMLAVASQVHQVRTIVQQSYRDSPAAEVVDELMTETERESTCDV